MFALTYTFSAIRLHKVSTLTSKQLSAKSCPNVIVLLCTAEAEWIKSTDLTDFKSI